MDEPPFFQEEFFMEAGVLGIGAIALLAISLTFMFHKSQSGRK